MSEHFKILYMTYFKKVYLTCFMILGSHALAEEVTQETFMTAYEKIHTLKDTAKFSTWLLAIARNKATNLYKRNKKVVPINNEDLLNYLEQQTDNKEDIADILVKKELIENVKKNITIMPPELRELIILKYYLQLKDQEISEITNKPLNTVKSSLHRARKVLAKSLSKEYVLSKERGDKVVSTGQPGFNNR